MKVNIVEATAGKVDTASPLNLVWVAFNNLAPLREILGINNARSGDVKCYRNNIARNSKVKGLAGTCLNTF